MIADRAMVASAIAAMVAAACSGSTGKLGGPVQGAQDTHCTRADGGVEAQPISAASCATSGGDAGSSYGPTMYNAEADDDDCKYHLKWSSTGVQQNNNVTFTVTATQKAAGTPAIGANLDIEAFLNTTHPAPNSGTHTTENGNGVYTIGPVRFDAPGQWTVRFHLHEECADDKPDSPHGHAAFYLDVP